MSAVGTKRINRSIQLTLDRTSDRLVRHEVDRSTDRIKSGHDRRRAFEKLDLLEISSLHHARSDIPGANPYAVIEYVYGFAAAGEAAHGKTRRRPAKIARQHANRAFCRLGSCAVSLLLHLLLGHDIHACRQLVHGKTDTASDS